jgi:hypothetical protein
VRLKVSGDHRQLVEGVKELFQHPKVAIKTDSIVPNVSVTMDQGNGSLFEVRCGDPTVESILLGQLWELGIKRVVVTRDDVFSAGKIHVMAPLFMGEEQQEIVERAVFRTVLLSRRSAKVHPTVVYRRWRGLAKSTHNLWKKLVPAVVVLFCATVANAQVNHTRLRFTMAVNAALHQTGLVPIPVRGTGAVIADSLAVRCVNAANNAFESCAGAGGSGGTASDFGSAFPAAGTAAGFSDGTNMQGARVFDMDTGGGSQFVLGVNLRTSASGGSTDVPLPTALGASGGFKVECLGGTCGGAASFADNSAFTFGTTGITNIGHVVDDVATNTVAENSAGAPRMNTNRIAYANIRNNAGTEVGTASNPFRVDLSPSQNVTVNQGQGSNTFPWSVQPGNFAVFSAAWTSATAIDTTISNSDAGTCLIGVRLTTTSTMTGGVINFEVSDGVTDYFPVLAYRAGSLAAPETTYSLTSPPDSKVWQVDACGFGSFRVRLNPAISGTGTANISVQGTGAALGPRVVGTQQVGSWAVTANAGTNLNTSALMLDATFTGRINTQGQKTMAASTPVVLPSDQSAIPVSQSGAWTVTTTPPANASTNVAQFGGTNVSTGTGAGGAGIPRVTISNDSSLAANQSVNMAQVGGTNTVTGGVAGSQGVGGLAASGAAKAGNPVEVGAVFNTTQPTVTNGQTVEAQATARGGLIVATGVDAFAVNNTQQGTASQNVAQFGGTNVSTGTGVSGAGIPRVTVSNDSNILATQSGTWTVQPGNTANTTPWLVKEQRAATSVLSNVTASASNVTCLASNVNRLGATIYNDSTADLFVKFGATASSTSFTIKLFADGLLVVPYGYTGILDCIWSSATGAARVTEVSS